MSEQTELILFDLGGVLVELSEEPVIPVEWISSGATLTLEKWFLSETASQFEKGIIGANEFAERLKNELEIVTSIETILHQITTWPIGMYSGAHDMLHDLQGKFRLAVLSNTNELHWPRITDEFQIAGYFESIFASHHLGMAKPESEIFQHVLGELDVLPERVVFLDDNTKNVEAARALGMNGYLVRGIDQVEDQLTRLGILELKETGSR